MNQNNTDTHFPEAARKFMDEQRGNCAQAVFSTFVAEHRPIGLDYETSLKLASPLGGGIAMTGNICGALMGALMVIGLKFDVGGYQGQIKTSEVGLELLTEFESLHGSTFCRELIDLDLIGKMDMELAMEKGAFNKCMNYVEDTAKILEKLFQDFE